MLNGLGKDQSRIVKSNSDDTLAVKCKWEIATTPGKDSEYVLTKPGIWADEASVGDDNKTGLGTTKLTWDLQ
jgi:hypothetical protein